MLGPLEVLREQLDGLRYVGPLREVPERHYQIAPTYEEARWATGLAAWDALHRQGELREQTSGWLAGRSRLGSGYELRLRLSTELASEVRNRLVHDVSGGGYGDGSGDGAGDGSGIGDGEGGGRGDGGGDVRAALLQAPQHEKLVLVQLTSSKRDGGLEVSPEDVGVGISQLVPVVRSEKVRLKRGHVRPMEVRSVCENLTDNGASRLSVLRKLHFDDDHAPVALDAYQVRIAGAELNLPPKNRHARRARERKQMGRLLDQRVKGCLVGKSRRRKQFPAGAVVPPDRGHAREAITANRLPMTGFRRRDREQSRQPSCGQSSAPRTLRAIDNDAGVDQGRWFWEARMSARSVKRFSSFRSYD